MGEKMGCVGGLLWPWQARNTSAQRCARRWIKQSLGLKRKRPVSTEVDCWDRRSYMGVL
jgi:hypothetical protein